MPDQGPTVELTILMPCLNEAETLADCIDQARDFLARQRIDGEVLIADNGSTDGSIHIAEEHGARVVHVARKGYGAALMHGMRAARGTYLIFGDCDRSYDFSRLEPFVERLRAGYDLVMGNRFLGGITRGAMPWLHKYVGNPVLSYLGRLFFAVPVGDFHCGLRGLRRERVLGLGLRAPGMEFASEMIVRAALGGLSIAEVPTTLSRDGRSRPPHLRTWRDGWRHLRFLLMLSPRWLFLYPGALLFSIGAIAQAAILTGPVAVGRVVLDIHTMLFAGGAMIAGVQMAVFSLIVKTARPRRGCCRPEQLPALRQAFNARARARARRRDRTGGLRARRLFAVDVDVGRLVRARAAPRHAGGDPLADPVDHRHRDHVLVVRASLPGLESRQRLAAWTLCAVRDDSGRAEQAIQRRGAG
jgi:hypothetical protein